MLTFREGGGLVNSLINNLPIELHIPGGYQFCGPGTKLTKRLRRGDSGINLLDKACKDHDIAYSNYKDLDNRHRADRTLEDVAWSRATAEDATIGEKTASWAVTNAMKIKRKLGMGLKHGGKSDRFKRKLGAGLKSRPRHRRRKQNQRPFKETVLVKARDALKSYKGGKIKTGAGMSLKAAKIAIKNVGGRKRIKMPRIIPLPKTGGILPLIPLFAGLSAVGSLAGGAAAIARTIGKTKEAQRQMEEAKRHNKSMEAIALGNRKGAGLYLKPYRKGLGLYLKPYPKN